MAETSTLPQKLAAEAIGTAVLVLIGCGSVTFALNSSGSSDNLDRFAFDGTVGLAFGLAIVVMVYSFGRVSGGHFNPAVSVGAALGGRIAWKEVPGYVAAQLLGGILGAGVLFVLLHGIDGFDATGNMGQNGFGDAGGGYSAWAAFLLEAVLTAVFLYVILAVTDARNEHPALAPLVIGLTLAVIHFVAIPATGTSVNPARSIGPALFAGGDAIKQLWLFILAPLLGGAAAGFTYPLIFGHAGEPVPGSGLNFSRPAPAGAVPGYGATDQFQQEWNQQTPGAGSLAVPQPEAQAAWAPASAQPEAAQLPPADRPPIVQDGWQWDYDAQEWKPVAQAPAPTPTPTPTPTPPPTDGGATQIRPPEAP